jgi:hemoglobin/transferrin/lactoferrin receptor protein
LALLVSGALAPAKAQDQAQPVSSINLDTITVLPNRTAENVWDSLSATSAVRQEEINQIQPRRIEDVLVGIPGVWVQSRSDSPETAISIRGLQDFGRVAVTVDGARQNFQRSGHGANGTFMIDPELLAGVDVVRGPVANVNGSGAIGGVASFRTKDVDDILRPGEVWGGQIHTELSSNPGNPLGSAFMAARSAGVDVIVGAAARDNRDYKDGNGDLVPNTGYDLTSGLAKLTMRPAEGHQIKLTGISQESNFKTGQGAAGGGTFESVYDSKMKNDIVSARWTYARPEDRLFNFDGNVYWTRTVMDQTKTEGAASPITGAVGNKRTFSIETAGFDLNNTSRFDTGPFRHALTYGGDFFRDDVINDDPNGNGGVLTPNGKRTVSGAFVQLKTNYSTWLELITALRYDNYTLDGGGTHNDGDHLSPKVTLGITPFSGVQFYGTYAEGYRAPAVTETLVTGAHPPFAAGFPDLFTLLPNPNLKPEIGKTKELGVNFKFDNILRPGDTFRAKANIFRNDVDDYIELVEFGPPVTFCAPFVGCPPGPPIVINPTSLAQYQNLTQARLDGIELEAHYDAGSWFAEVAGSHVRGKDVGTGQPLATVPPDKVSFTYGMRFLDRKLTTAVRWIGVAAKKANDIPDRNGDGIPDMSPVGGYGIVNLYMGYEPKQDVLLSFSVENLFDKQYVPYLNEAANISLPMPGITVKAGIQIRFSDAYFKKG